jgi:hypothetical protein
MAEEYLTVSELGQRLKLSPKSIANKMSAGVFVEGVHYFRPPGLRPRFKWTAIVAWLEGEESAAKECTDKNAIPMAKGYFLPEIRSRKPQDARTASKPYPSMGTIQAKKGRAW